MPTIDIPQRCGVMILPDCTLFPHGGLPLRIFEPRYRRMLDEALEGNCVFAVARRIGGQGDGPERAADVGTVGLIRTSRQQQSGESELLLQGLVRVRFRAWDDQADYPRAELEPVLPVFEPESQAKAAMATLRGAVEDAVVSLPADVQAGVVSLLDQADEPGLMADMVCQQFVHDPDLRQELLEMESVGERIPVVCDYLRKVGPA